MGELEPTNFIAPEQKEQLKLMKMSKGYNWEIKLVGDINHVQLNRLDEINEQMRAKYGSNE